MSHTERLGTSAGHVNPFWVKPGKGFTLASGSSNSVAVDLYKRLRESLVEARKSATLTQAELAARLARPQSFVSKYERGERRLDVVEFGEVARALRIDPLRFLGRLYREET